MKPIDKRRRTLLRAALGSLVFLAAPSRARAEVTVGAVIAVVQFGIAVSKMFKRPSASSSTSAEIALLRTISQQVEFLQNALDEVLKELHNITKILGAMPELVVTEITQKNIQGALLGYKEILAVFEGYNGDYSRFRAEQGHVLQELYSRIVQHRSVLVNYDEYLNIPFVSMAFAIEYGLTQFLGLPQVNVDAIIKQTYVPYFKRVLMQGPTNLAAQLASERDLRVQLLQEADLTKLVVYRTRYHGVGKWWWSRRGYLRRTVKFSAIPDRMHALDRLGLILENERPATLPVEIVTRPTNQAVYVFSTTSLDYAPLSIDANPLNGTPWLVGESPTLAEGQAAEANAAKTLENKLNVNLDKIAAMSSCNHAGLRALNFCNQFALWPE